MIPAFIMIGSMIIPATSPGCSSSSRATLSMSLKAATRVSRMNASGIPVLDGVAAAFPAVQFYVLVAVAVVDLGAAAVAEPDGLRDGDLPARGDPAGQRLARSGGHPPRLRLALGENPFLFGDDEFKVCRQPHGAVLRAGHDAS